MSNIIELSTRKGDAGRLTKARYELLNDRNKAIARGYAAGAYISTLGLSDVDIEELFNRLLDVLKLEVADYIEELLQGQDGSQRRGSQ